MTDGLGHDANEEEDEEEAKEEVKEEEQGKPDARALEGTRTESGEPSTDGGAEPLDDPVTTAPDEGIVGPTPGHAPREVVDVLSESIEAAPAGDGTDRGERRRRALQGEVGPYRTAFALASPRLRTSHGDVVAFATAMADPITRPLFRATTVERGPIEFADDVEVGGDRAVVTVLARPDPDAGVAEPRTYDLTLRRQSAGKYAGCWLLEEIELVYVGVSPRFRRQPSVSFAGETVQCEDGETLRDVLLDIEGRTPYNDAAQIANCGGNGLCGTCAVGVEGETDEPGRRERSRLSMPPFDGEDDLRLSCQTCVRGDLEVRKHDGLWGQHVSELDDGEGADSDAASEGAGAEPIRVTTAEFGGSFEYDPAAITGGEGTESAGDDGESAGTDGGDSR